MAKKTLIIITILLTLFVFRNWLFQEYITGGDWPFYFPEYFDHSDFIPQAWVSHMANGLGGKIITYSVDSYMFLTYRLSELLGLSWHFSYKVLWFGLFIFMSTVGSYFLSKEIFAKKSEHILSSLIYTTNTYILMVVGGGQMGVALAYAVCPIASYFFIKNIKEQTLRNLIMSGISLGLLITFDIRIFAILFLFIMIVSFGFNKFSPDKKRNQLIPLILRIFILPLVLAFTLNSYWLLPNLLNPYNPLEKLGSAYTSVQSLKFFSFATLSNSISLLHPNWPENLFGKVIFQKPEFLVLPLIAFFSLLFKKETKIIYPLILISLTGIFLGKGSNAPFGEIYVFLFEKVPLFQMFRDSTKWYVLTAISFSLVIPFALNSLSQFLKKRKLLKNYNWEIIILLSFIIFWVFTIRESFTTTLSGTFKTSDVPKEYYELKDKLLNDKEFYRTLWVPRQQRFTYSDHNHPSMEAMPLFEATDSSELKNAFQKDTTKKYLKELSIKFIIIPYDPIGEIFLDDRKYSKNVRQKYIDVLDSVSYINKIQNGNLTIYSTQGIDPLIKSNDKKVDYKRISSTKYELISKLKENESIIFSQKYHPNWKLAAVDASSKSVESIKGFNSFKVPQNNGKLTIVFTEQKNYNIAWLLTLLALAISLFLLFKTKK